MTGSTFVGYSAAAALALGATACDSEARVLEGTGSGTEPAVMVAVASRSPEGTNFYVGAYPELPAQVELADMLETPSGQNAATYGGYIYVWDAESGVYTRYAVDDARRLSEAGSVSFVNEGGTGNIMTGFVSTTRAYSMTRDNMQIIVWNPTDMTVTGSIDTSAALDPDYPSFDYGEPVVFGDYVAWPILWYDDDNADYKPAVDIILASATNDEPAMAISDRRCGGGWSLFTDDEGDLYALGNAYFGYAHFDPARQPKDCLLRVRAGSTEFDPDFYVDLNRATNSDIVYHTWQTSGRSVVAAVLDPATDASSIATPDDYWSTPMQRTLVRVDQGDSEPVTGIPASAVFSTLNYRLDGELFMLMSEGSAGPAGDASSTLYRIDGSVAEVALRTSGDIWSIGRIR